MQTIRDLLSLAADARADNLYLSADNPPVVRIGGDLRAVSAEILSADDVRALGYSLLTSDQIAQFERDQELEFAYSLPNGKHFDVNLFSEGQDISVAFQVVP